LSLLWKAWLSQQHLSTIQEHDQATTAVDVCAASVWYFELQLVKARKNQ
jgi:hypothetical protein